MKKSSFVLALSTSLLTSAALAGTMGSIAPMPSFNYVGSLSVGPVWQKSGATQTFGLAPGIVKTYAADKGNDVLADGELFFGVQRALNSGFLGQLGVAVAATSNANVSGLIWDDADQQFANYSYDYKIQHTHVALKGKVIADNDYWVMPWISGSIGVGFNNAHSFNNIPLIFEAVTNPNFSSHTETTFTYTVGVGVQKTITTNWQVGLGYEFADWGKNRLGAALGQTRKSNLAFDHLYTNGLLFNLTYIA